MYKYNETNMANFVYYDIVGFVPCILEYIANKNISNIVRFNDYRVETNDRKYNLPYYMLKMIDKKKYALFGWFFASRSKGCGVTPLWFYEHQCGIIYKIDFPQD